MIPRYVLSYWLFHFYVIDREVQEVVWQADDYGVVKTWYPVGWSIVPSGR